MAQVPRLPAVVEHLLVKFVCGLPSGVQKLLFGEPPVLDGQQLAMDIHALLWLDRLVSDNGFSKEKGVEETRADRLKEARIVAHRPPIAMARVEELELPGPAGPLRARLYTPPAAQEPSRLLVYFHGGGWVIGDLDTHDDPCRFLAAHSGVKLLSVDYRLAPEHPFPAAAEDASAAYQWAAAEAGRLGVDAGRIAVGGDSAGGNLAAAACLIARESGFASPAMQLLIYPVTETAGTARSRRTFAEGFLLTRGDMDWFEERYLPPGVDREDPRVALLGATDVSGLPPAYIATAGFDPLRDEGEAYAQRLREAGVRVAVRRHPGLTHTFANLTAICPSARQAMLEAAGALRMGLG
jgi:acetyl esterase/lipase